MTKHILLLISSGLLLLGLACAPKAPDAEAVKKTADAAYENASAAVDVAKTPREKVAVCAAFLRHSVNRSNGVPKRREPTRFPAVCSCYARAEAAVHDGPRYDG